MADLYWYGAREFLEECISCGARFSVPLTASAGFSPMPLSFPNIGNAAQIVGRTPWSARVPLDPLLANRIRVVPAGQGRRGRRPRTRGSAPRLVQIVRSWEK